MRLESAITRGIQDHYDFDLGETISFDPAIRNICEDLRAGVKAGIIAARFHNTIVEASVQAVEQMNITAGIQQVALSGGSFQNKYLLESLESRLIKNNLTVYTHSKVPCNDGGIALGQLAVAARRKLI
jgi:hydrogenase maturation protein HypF